MNRRNVFSYLAALLAVFLLGCGAALALRAYDQRLDAPAPLSGGKALDLSAFGFTLRVPQEFTLHDTTPATSPSDGGALFSGCAEGGDQALYLYCYKNDQGDSIDGYTEQELVTYYMSAGCADVRTRELGGRRFICYSAQAEVDGETQTWRCYETWDASTQLVFETRMAAKDTLAILATIEFVE